MKDQINRLVDKPLPDLALDAASAPPAIREKTGLEPRRAADINSNEITVESSDGLFTFIVMVVKR